MWSDLSDDEKEAVYLVLDVVDLLGELGAWRFPVGAVLSVVFAVLFVLRQRGLIRGIQDDVVCAVMEYAALVAGLVVGGPAFAIGALMMRAMHKLQYRLALILLVLLFLAELCPSLLFLLPRRPVRAEEPLFWGLMPKF